MAEEGAVLAAAYFSALRPWLAYAKMYESRHGRAHAPPNADARMMMIAAYCQAATTATVATAHTLRIEMPSLLSPVTAPRRRPTATDDH